MEYERPAPETEPHIIAPLIVGFPDGRRITVRRWSLSGIHDQALAGHELTGTRLMIPFQGVEVSFPVTLTPAEDGCLWSFEGLTGRQREAIGLFYRNLMTGKMAATDEMITALDTPVDLVPMGETKAEKAASTAKSGPRPFRAALNIAWYVGLFILIIGLLGSFVWSRIEGVVLSHSRVIAERTELRAPREGYVQHLVAQDVAVSTNANLARIEKPEGDVSIADAERRYNAIKDLVAEWKNRLATHLLSRTEVRQLIVRMYSQTAVARFDAGVPLRSGDFNDTRMQLENNLRMAENDLDRAGEELRRLRRSEQFTNIVSPTAGLIGAWLTRSGQFVRQGDLVGMLEFDTPRQVRGWLDDRLAGTLRVGMDARVRIRSAGVDREHLGKVVAVTAGADPAAPDQFGMLVTIAVPGLSTAETRNVFPFNSPVEVIVRRNLLQHWLSWIKR